MALNQFNFDRVYPVPADALYEALAEAAAGKGYQRLRRDLFTQTVTFKTPRTFMSWGHTWQAQALPDERGSRLHLTGTSFRGTGPTSNDKVAMKRAEKLFADVSRRLHATV